MKVIYSAAHAGFSSEEPLGGGQTIAEWLICEWNRHTSFQLEVLSPKSLGMQLSMPLTQMKELEYSRFCRQFEEATTKEILKYDPKQCTILNNDICESPSLSILAQKKYQVVTIVHVDVVEYVSKFYLLGFLRPEKLARLHGISQVLPKVVRLVVEKQYVCIRDSACIVVPSQPMKDVLLRCYPWCNPQKINVIPWGNVSRTEQQALLPPLKINDDEFVIMTMSRLSPEKGIEHCIAAMRYLVTHGRDVRLIICGAPAYMKGFSYERKLKSLAKEISGMQIEFAGHITGKKKTALLKRADLFVSPSQHESYGLALAEAEVAGCSIISHPHYGARGTIVDCKNHQLLARVISRFIEELTNHQTSNRSIPLNMSDNTNNPPKAHENLAKILSNLQ